MTQMRAALNPLNGSSVAGTVTARSYGTDSTHVAVLITGGTPGAVYPWHVHQGNCTKPGAVVGNPALYTPLKVGGDGTAAGDALIPMGLAGAAHGMSPNGQYSVNVHQSATELGKYVACGDLTAP